LKLDDRQCLLAGEGKTSPSGLNDKSTAQSGNRAHRWWRE